MTARRSAGARSPATTAKGGTTKGPARKRATKKRAGPATADDARARVKAYLDALPRDAKRALTALRAAVRAAAPGVEDAWSYGIPAFRHEGRMLVGYSAWKDYVSLYPFGTAVLRAQAKALEGYDMSKGSIRFPLPDPPPAKVVTRIVRASLAEGRPPKRS